MIRIEDSAFARFVVPAVLTPSQYYDGVHRDDHETQSLKRLMLASLSDAVRSFQAYACARNRARRLRFAEAKRGFWTVRWAWIAHDLSSRVFCGESLRNGECLTAAQIGLWAKRLGTSRAASARILHGTCHHSKRLTRLGGQLYANLIAPTLADDCKIDDLACLGLADRAPEVVEITRSLTVDRYNQIMRFARAALLDRHDAHYRGRKEKCCRAQRDGQRRPDCRSSTSYAGRRARAVRARCKNRDPAQQSAAFEFAPPIAYLHPHQRGFIGVREVGCAPHIIVDRAQIPGFAIRNILPRGGNRYVRRAYALKYNPRH
jgi:hypothetical protein